MFLDKDFPRPTKAEADVLAKARKLKTFQPASSEGGGLIAQPSEDAVDRPLKIQEALYEEAD